MLVYDKLRSYCIKISETNDLTNFKINDDICSIFEHKDSPWGIYFYNLIKNEFSIPDEIINDFCNINDKIGNPQLFMYPFGHASANSIKYIYHSNLALNHMKNVGKTKINITEIGGGYGGMALAIFYFAKYFNIEIESYNIIDLPEVIELQKLYLKNFDNFEKCYFYESNNYGSDIANEDMFLIGIYSIGELDLDYQMKYINKLLPKTSHGFIVWNRIPYTNLEKNEIRIPERPMTGPHNQFIFF